MFKTLAPGKQCVVADFTLIFRTIESPMTRVAGSLWALSEDLDLTGGATRVEGRGAAELALQGRVSSLGAGGGGAAGRIGDGGGDESSSSRTENLFSSCKSQRGGTRDDLLPPRLLPRDPTQGSAWQGVGVGVELTRALGLAPS